ncbi:MAG: 50S ribosomal protein L30e [Promethearchaeota archaeon]
MIDVDKALRIAIKSGKIIIGSKRTLEDMKKGRTKLIIIASNTPSEIAQDVEYYAKLSRVPIFVYPGSSWDLGSVCGKPFMVSTLAITDPGDSDILKLAEV